MTKLSLNSNLNSTSLTCLLCSITVEQETDYTWEGSAHVVFSFFNCFHNFNRNHLSLSAAERQPVEILWSLRVFNSCNSTSIRCSNPPIPSPHTNTHTPTHTSTHWLLPHSDGSAPSAFQPFNPTDRSKGMLTMWEGLTFSSQHLYFPRGR